MVTMPVEKDFYVTSGFGPRWGTYHWGTDFGCGGGSGGRPVYAVKDGTVVRVGAASGFGQWVCVDHPATNGGGETIYGHVIPEVRMGQKVREGQRIARINPDRNTNGGVAPHLHMEWHRFTWVERGPDRLNPMVKLKGAKWPGKVRAGETLPPAPKQGDNPMGKQFQADIDMLTTVDRGRRNPAKVPHITLHTYECPRESGGQALRNRAGWQQESRTGSYTFLIAADGTTLRANDDNYTPCASLVTGDVNGFHLSFLGYARDSRAEWLKYPDQLRAAARIGADYCRRYGHEPRHLSVAEVRGRKAKGFATHGDISAAFRESDHTDPGPNFPWDVFLQMVKQELKEPGRGEPKPSQPTEPDPKPTGASPKSVETLILEQLGGPVDRDGVQRFAGWPQLGGRTLVDALAAVGEKLEVEGMRAPRPPKKK